MAALFGGHGRRAFELLHLGYIECTGYENRANISNAPGRTILLGLRGQF